MKFQTVMLEDRVVESDFDFQSAAQERTGLERGSEKAAPSVAADTSDTSDGQSESEESEDA